MLHIRKKKNVFSTIIMIDTKQNYYNILFIKITPFVNVYSENNIIVRMFSNFRTIILFHLILTV